MTKCEFVNRKRMTQYKTGSRKDVINSYFYFKLK